MSSDILVVRIIVEISNQVFCQKSVFTLYGLMFVGVFKDQTCSFEKVNHVVQLVGYGQNEMGEKFWIVKNSWGINITQ